MKRHMGMLRVVRLAMALYASALVADAVSAAGPKLPVVASFSILGDITSRVGGDRVDLVTLVGPQGDAHVFEPGPAEAQAVAKAAMLVVNGLGYEGWMDRLKHSAGFKGIEVVATAGIQPLTMTDEDDDHDHSGVDPHAWQDVGNTEAYVRNVATALERADPEGADFYRRNSEAYLAELRALDAEIRASMDAVPPERRILVTSHDAFGYFAAAYGVTFKAPQGISTESEASARDVAALIRQIREENVRAVFVENITNPRLLEQIGRESGAAIGGTLFSDALSPPDGPAPTYVEMMRHNASTIASAFES